MSRRSGLPGADELFRTTAATDSATADLTGSATADSAATDSATAGSATADSAATDSATLARLASAQLAVDGGPDFGAGQVPGRDVRSGRSRRRSYRGEDRRPSGRERHDEKITVYVSAEELIDLEQARLTLRGEHGMAVDRGRIVREALAVVLADLDARAEASVLVQRLRGH